jgi:hypothetical protein
MRVRRWLSTFYCPGHERDASLVFLPAPCTFTLNSHPTPDFALPARLQVSQELQVRCSIGLTPALDCNSLQRCWKLDFLGARFSSGTP